MADAKKSGEKRVRVGDESFVVEWVRVAALIDNDGKRIGTHQMIAESLGLQETSVIQRQYAVNRKLTSGGFEKLPKMASAGRQSVNIAELAKLAGLKALAEADKADKADKTDKADAEAEAVQP